MVGPESWVKKRFYPEWLTLQDKKLVGFRPIYVVLFAQIEL